MNRLKFIDKSTAGNLEAGLEYFATGLIVGCHMENGVPCESGKDYAGEYIAPCGSYQHELVPKMPQQAHIWMPSSWPTLSAAHETT